MILNKLKVLMLVLFFVPLHFMAQNSDADFLRGLKKSEKPLPRMDGESVPVYLPEGKRVKNREMMEAMVSGNYKPELFENDQGEIKAILLRRLSDQEIADKKELSKKRMAEKQPISIPAKDFTVKDLNGKSYNLKDLKGKIVVINFWFTQCKPCLIEIPKLNKLTDKYAGKEVIFLGISYEEKERIQSFLAKKEFKYNIIPAAKNIADLYEVTGYPTHLVIDQNSNIVFETKGLSNDTVEEIDFNIERLLK